MIGNSNRVILDTLNINSIRNKCSSLKELVPYNIDELVIEETELNETFPAKYFVISGYIEPFRKNRNAHGGGIMVFIREDIPSRKLPTIDDFADFEGLFIEINFRKIEMVTCFDIQAALFFKRLSFCLC